VPGTVTELRQTFHTSGRGPDDASPGMRIQALDHLVLTVSDLEATIVFYERLGMRHVEFDADRHALAFGTQKLNLHVAGREFEPKAALPTPGSADLCFLVDDLDTTGLDVIEGPVERTGAMGGLRSVYVRDPDGNLVELSMPQ
jgi:catechol 2,3-dioxygenase-like lactoylglutathione lyase family enzyme